MNYLIPHFVALKAYCEREDFKGWDPYDGLNSKVFQALPLLKKSAVCRLVVIQGFKRCPINLRKFALVPKEYNAKGIGLFLSGYCNLYHVVNKHPEWSEILGTPEEIKIGSMNCRNCLSLCSRKDIVVHAGDITSIGRQEGFSFFRNTLLRLWQQIFVPQL